MVSLPEHLKFNVNTSKSETIRSDGSADIYIGPAKVRERWVVDGLSTSIDSNDNSYSPVLHVRKNGHELIAGTYNANDDTSAGDSIELRNGERLKFSVTGAEPGKYWEITVSGKGYAV